MPIWSVTWFQVPGVLLASMAYKVYQRQVETRRDRERLKWSNNIKHISKVCNKSGRIIFNYMTCFGLSAPPNSPSNHFWVLEMISTLEDTRQHTGSGGMSSKWASTKHIFRMHQPTLLGRASLPIFWLKNDMVSGFRNPMQLAPPAFRRATSVICWSKNYPILSQSHWTSRKVSRGLYTQWSFIMLDHIHDIHTCAQHNPHDYSYY